MYYGWVFEEIWRFGSIVTILPFQFVIVVCYNNNKVISFFRWRERIDVNY